jgi:endoribonuclease LACTB2
MENNTQFQIIRFAIPSPTLWPHTTTNCYLIGNEQESLLIDTGYDQDETKQELDKVIHNYGLARPESIFITHSHSDHATGLRQLTDWSATVYFHELESKALGKLIPHGMRQSLVKEGDVLNIADVKLDVLHTPGHTAGHLSLYIPSKEVLIAGDNLVAEGTTWIGKPDGDMSDYMHSLKRLRKLNLTRVGPGHGDWVDNPYEHIDFVLGRRQSREKQIINLLENHKVLSLTQLTSLIYEKSIHPSIVEVAKRTIEAHLTKLINEGTVLERDSVYLLCEKVN